MYDSTVVVTNNTAKLIKCHTWSKLSNSKDAP